MDLYHRAPGLELYCGNARDSARYLEPGIAQTIVTSPPYFGLRDYGHPDQLGAEATVEQYVDNLVAVFASLRTILADDGVLWLNLGDSYGRGSRSIAQPPQGFERDRTGSRRPQGAKSLNMPNKSLLMVPHRVALAMAADGWTLRSEVIWHKPNPMPESVRDRPTRAHEFIFMFSKRPSYYYDADAVAEPAVRAGEYAERSGKEGRRNPRGDVTVGATRNRRDVWAVGFAPFKGAHFATFPPELVRVPILATSRPGDLVLDPFSGSGTTGMVALSEGRRYLGIDLSTDYLDLSIATRFAETSRKAS